jgi:threonine/homoserine/homoserine lactone efflux protein
MPLESVFDEINEVELQKKRRKKVNTRITIIIISCAFNIVVTGFWGKIYPAHSENLRNAITSFGVVFNLLGIILGAIIALFPYKSLSYNTKFGRASMIGMMCIQLIFTLLIIVNFFLHLMGYHSMFTPRG